MSDIFISYARTDRVKAKLLADALARQGWSVWWDRNIPPGRSFDEVIENALDSAKCVIVLWSQQSVSSAWVKTEAGEGARRRILIPVLIENVKVPLEFRRIQTASLLDWQGTSDHDGLGDVLDAVRHLLDDGSTKGAERDQIRQTPGTSAPPFRQEPLRPDGTGEDASSPAPGQQPPSASRKSFKSWTIKWSVLGSSIGAVAGFVLGIVDDGPLFFTPELFLTWVGGGALWGLLGGAGVGMTCGILVYHFRSDGSL